MGDYQSGADLVSQLQDMRTRIAVLERTVRSRRSLYASASGTVSTSSPNAVDLGGPSISLDAPDGALVALGTRCEFRTVGSAGGSAAVAFIDTTDASFGAPAPNMTTPSASFVVGESRVMSVFRALPGPRTYALGYWLTGGGGSAEFRNRELWAVLI